MSRQSIQSVLLTLPALAWPAALIVLGLAAADGAPWLRPALPEAPATRATLGLGLVLVGLAAFSAGATERLGLRTRLGPWAWAAEVLTLAAGLAAVMIGSIR